MAEPIIGGGGVLRRFLLEALPVRGHWVSLGAVWPALRAYQQYPPPVEALLGEAATAAVLLAATLKFDGTLTLQLTGSGRVRLLVAQCTHDFRLRAMAEHDVQAGEVPAFAALAGQGRLIVTLEAEQGGTRYQGVVPLEGVDLAACLEGYFAHSEQLPTRLKLSADAAQAAGLLLQKLPSPSSGEAAEGALEDAWSDLQNGMAALSPALLRLGAGEEIVRAVFGAHDSRLFAATPVRFACRCSPERVAGLLRALGAQEAREVLAEQGAVRVTCEFCGRPYVFDAVDIDRLFAPAATLQDGPPRVH